MTETATGFDTVIYSEADHIATVTLNRPDKLNAFNMRQYDEVRKALGLAAASSSVRVAVINSSSGRFSAGADITEWAEPPEITDDEPHGFLPFVDQLATFEKPLIAAVNGVAVGIGVTMLLHCDFVLAADDARFRTPFVSLGLMPEAGSSFLLPRLVGRQAAAELLIEGGWISAQRAVEIGLALRVVPAEELQAEAMRLAGAIAKHPRRSLVWAKRLLLAADADMVAAARAREDAIGLEAGRSPENLEAIQAFMNKREADFSQFD